MIAAREFFMYRFEGDSLAPKSRGGDVGLVIFLKFQVFDGDILEKLRINTSGRKSFVTDSSLQKLK